MVQQFVRPVAEHSDIPSFLDEAGRLRAFLPPFRFTSFFSPEDTLLCMCAAEAALAHARMPRSIYSKAPDAMRIAELTTGSGLVGFHLLQLEHGSELAALDVHSGAVDVASRNARLLGLASRVRLETADLWSNRTLEILQEYEPQLLVCNPPYVPEPPDGKLELEAGAGPDGAAHLMRTLEIAEKTKPRAMALSWCSLSDPAGVIREAEAVGYTLNSLFIVAIADGEYSGSVREYLRTLRFSYINEQPETVNIVAPDGSGRFAYLLMAGDFSRSSSGAVTTFETANSIERLCERFALRGVSVLRDAQTTVPTRTWLLDRWDELRLRAYLHGNNESANRSA